VLKKVLHLYLILSCLRAGLAQLCTSEEEELGDCHEECEESSEEDDMRELFGRK